MSIPRISLFVISGVAMLLTACDQAPKKDALDEDRQSIGGEEISRVQFSQEVSSGYLGKPLISLGTVAQFSVDTYADNSQTTLEDLQIRAAYIFHLSRIRSYQSMSVAGGLAPHFTVMLTNGTRIGATALTASVHAPSGETWICVLEPENYRGLERIIDTRVNSADAQAERERQAAFASTTAAIADKKDWALPTVEATRHDFWEKFVISAYQRADVRNVFIMPIDTAEFARKGDAIWVGVIINMMKPGEANVILANARTGAMRDFDQGFILKQPESHDNPTEP